MSNPLACQSCPVRDRAACSALSGDERRDLARLGQHRTLRRGETFTATGDEQVTCATLISGVLKICSYGDDGTERILSLVHPAGFVGELFAPVARHDVVALTDSEICVFPSTGYRRAVDRFPSLAQALLRRSSEDVFAGRTMIDLIGQRTARQRVSGFLLAMAQAASTSPCHPADKFDLPLTRGEIANMLGTTIETVSRQLTSLEREGMIVRVGKRAIGLVDRARLAESAA